LPQAPVATTLWLVAVAQLLIFAAFVVAVAVIDRVVIGRKMLVFPILFVLSLAPLYVAMANYWTTADTVFLMYSCLALAVLSVAQLSAEAIVRRAPISSPAR